MGSDWDGVCGVPGIGKAAITDQSAHKHWNEENIGNLGKTNLKERLFKMFQYKRCRIKLKNQEFESNSTFTVPQFKVMGDSLTPQKIVIHPNTIYTKDEGKLDVKHTKSLPFEKSTKTEYSQMVSYSHTST